MKQLNTRLASIDMSPIREVFDKARTLTAPVNLSIGIPHIDTPERVKDAFMDALSAGKNSYTPTQGSESLRSAIREKVSDQGMAAEDWDVLVTAGAAGALDLVLRTILEPGDEVVVPDPCFVSHTAISYLCGAEVKLLDTYPDFRLHEESLRERINDNTKALILNSPHNPTGRVYSREEILAVARVASEHDLFIVSDEVYEAFIFEGEHESVARHHPSTIITSSFSKSHAVTGWRIGYAAGPSEVINEMAKLQQFTYVCAPSPAQAAMAQESSVPAATRKIISRYKENRDLLQSGLQDMYDFTVPEGAFYAFLAVPSRYEDADAFVKQAIDENLLIVPGKAFSARNTHVRISFATDADTLQQGIEILKRLS